MMKGCGFVSLGRWIFHAIRDLRVFTFMFAEEAIMDQFLERLFDSGVTWFRRQFRKPPVQDSGLCVLCVWILAQVFPDRPHSLSYARFVHHILSFATQSNS